MGRAPSRGPFLQRSCKPDPVLSGHLSLRPTWTSPGRVIGPAWPCTGRGLPGRRVTAAPVRSYRTISPLPVRDSHAVYAIGRVFLWHFPAGFPGWALPTASPFGVRTFLEGFSLPPRSLGPHTDGSAPLTANPGTERRLASSLQSHRYPRQMPSAVVTGAGSGLGQAI